MNSYLLRFFACAGLCLLVREGTAQSASDYSFSSISSTYTYLSGGTAISAIQTDDAISAAIPIGFTFNYCGSSYTQLIASSNGWVSFNTDVPNPYGGNTLGNLKSIKPALFPLWDNINGSTSYGGAASYKTTGTAPSREFVIEYKNWQWNNTATTAAISFQIKLFEGSDIIQFRYKRESGAVVSGSASIGIADNASTPTYLSLPDSTASPAVSSSLFRTTIKGRPSDGRVYQFNPPPPTCSPPSPGATTASPAAICWGNAITLTIASPPSGTGNTFQWQSSPDNVTYTDISGALTLTHTANPTAAAWYRCKVSCAAGPVSAISTPVYVAYMHNVSSVSNAARCGTGTVSLGATAGSGTLQWYTAATGGSPVGSGSPFTTPVITATTNYYVAAESSGSGTGAIGSGGKTSGASGTSPFSQSWESNHSQYLVLADELAAAGFGPGGLSALSMNVTSKISTEAFSGYTIKLAHTAATSLSGLLSPSFTTVYGPSAYNSVAGTNSFTFTTPFTWDGSSNLLLDICFDNDPELEGDFSSFNDKVEATEKAYTAVYGMYEDDAELCGAVSGGMTASAFVLPVFTFTGNKVCSSPRMMVTATVNPAPAFALSGTQTVCNNSIAALSVSSPLSNYTEYVWTPAAGLYTDAAATIPYSPGSSAATVYARTSSAGTQMYTCNAGNAATMCAATGSVTVTTLPASVTAIASPASLCQSGTATLRLSPSASGFGEASFQWAVSADNITFSDIASATSGTYTTPVLSATNYYRAAIRNSVGSLCLNSVSDTVQIINPMVSSAVDGSRCGPGTVDLSASGTDGVLKWYASSSGGTPLGSGTTFTTPALSSSATYYVAAEGTAIPGTVFVGAGAKTTVSTGAASDMISPFDYYFGGIKKQYLFRAAELEAMGLAAGDITAVAFDVVSGGRLYEGFRLSIGTSTASVMSTAFVSGLTNVYTTSAPAGYTTPASGLATIPFSVPFYWDGASNLVIETCWSNDNSGGTGTTVKYDGTAFVAANYYRVNTKTPDVICSSTATSATLSSRPKMVFSGFAGCRSSRTAVTATINPLPLPSVDPSPGPVEICEGNMATLTGKGGGAYLWRNAAGRISGATAAAFTTGKAGSYQLIVTDAVTGCMDSSAAVKINVNPNPTVSINPSDPVTICADAAQIYKGAFSGRGLSYQWFRSGTAIPGATDTFYAANTTGTYTLRVYLGSCSDTSNEASLNVNPLPPSDFTRTGATGAICQGSSLELTAIAIPAGWQYQWLFNGADIPGADKRKYLAATGGYYSVRIRDANNCRKVSDEQLIINTPMGIPDLSPKDVMFCEGTTIKLYANAGPYAAAYAWAKDGLGLPDKDGSIAAAATGAYEVTATDIYGCKATSEKVSVTVEPLPLKPLITHAGSMLSVSGIYASYQWYRDGKKINGATKSTLTLSFDGNYHVVVSGGSGCENTSDTIVLKKLAVEEIGPAMSIKLYPNPAQSMVYIESPIPVTLLLRDPQGRRIAEVSRAEQIDLSVYADGLYLFTFYDEQGQLLGTQNIMKKTE